jgi:hypothetical protein
VVLWLAERLDGRLVVRAVFTPIQQASADYFKIPREGMDQLLSKIRDTRYVLAAQVHTHPKRAFHSAADDRWAIVRHEGALSLVVPNFCQKTSAATFMHDAVVYCLTADNKFVHTESRAAYRVTQ